MYPRNGDCYLYASVCSSSCGSCWILVFRLLVVFLPLVGADRNLMGWIVDTLVSMIFIEVNTDGFNGGVTVCIVGMREPGEQLWTEPVTDYPASLRPNAE